MPVGTKRVYAAITAAIGLSALVLQFYLMLGYGRIALNIAGLGAIFLGLGLAAIWLGLRAGKTRRHCP